MKKTSILMLFLCVSLLASASGRRMDKVTDEGGYGEKLGSVNLYMNYETSAEYHIRKGMALLHHMTYTGAREEFIKAIEKDPQSAMGYWGQAMTYIHPLWSDPPSEEDYNLGAALLEEAKIHQRGREADYIEAAEAYYGAGRGVSEKENLRAFAEGWRRVYEKYPEDTEAAAFYALAYLSTADPGDKEYTVQRRVGEIGGEVLDRTEDHPGGHHYVIHAYDYPVLAPMGLDTARSYGDIAPAVPHALHMPTHIFTRLGLWDESIEMNRRSADAALMHPSGEKISLHYPHAVDYMVYAYIQKGEDERAEEALSELMEKREEFQTHVASHYTFNAAPARLLLERQRWEEAAVLEPWHPVNYEDEKYPAMDAITYFARALGAARSDQPKEAGEALEKLEELRAKAAETSPYWAKQIEIQYLAAKAWLVYNSDEEDGLKLMRSAAELEGTTEKHPVTPGEVLPARELYGDMLMEVGMYREAQREYEKALERSPNRYNSLYGAGRSSELLGDEEKALSYYRKLAAQTEDAEKTLDKTAEARMFIEERKQ